MWLIGSLLVLVGLLPLLQGGGGEPPAASAKPNPYAKFTRKALVQNQFNEAMRQAGAVFITDYPYRDQSLWRLTEEQAKPFLTDWGTSIPGVKFIENDDKTQMTGINYSLGAPSPYAPPELYQYKIAGYQHWSLQFAGPTKGEWRLAIEAMGIEIINNLGGNGAFIWATGEQIDQLENMVSPSSFIQWVGPLHPYYRMGDVRPDLPEATEYYNQPIFKGFISFHNHPKIAETLARLEALHPQKISKPSYNQYDKMVNVYVEIPSFLIIPIANWADFRQMYSVGDTVELDERQDQLIAGNLSLSTESSGQTVSVPSSAGYLNWLTSKGFPNNPANYPRVAVVDSGVDNGTIAPGHPDFRVAGNPANNSRLVGNFNCTNTSTSGDTRGHGSLVASIIGAYNNQTSDPPNPPHRDSASYHHNLGVSPFGQIVSVKVMDPDGRFDRTYCPDDTSIVAETVNLGTYITNNSWGNLSSPGVYDARARIYDDLTRNARIGTPAYPMLHIFAAGNTGKKGPKTVLSPATAKNVLTIGASENVRDNGIVDGCGQRVGENADKIASFSSRGPTLDGRAKPDIVAPGTHIQGAASKDLNFNGSGICGAEFNFIVPNGAYRYYPLTDPLQDLYTWANGTSFAAPAAAGAAQLVYEYYKRILKPNEIPSPAMLKALLINAARYLNHYGGGDNLPSPNQGWGALNLALIVDNTPRHLHDQATVLNASTEEYLYHGTIANSTKPLRVTLVWTDAPGVVGGQILQNDLNLEVTLNGQIYRGNFFKKAFSQPGGQFDTVNNVENIFLPPGLSGTFQVRVRAETLRAVGVPGAGADNNQDFALVIYNANSAATPGVLLGQGLVVTSDASPTGNGNAAPEPNEFISMTIPIFNKGASPASNVTSSLAISGTGGTVVTETVSYGTIGANAVVAPTAPFGFRVAPGLPCGTPLVMTQTIFYNGNQKQTVLFNLATGSPRLGTFTLYKATDIPQSIPDAVDPPPGEVNEAGVPGSSQITITTPGTIAKVQVAVTITHGFVGDLRLILTSPTGRQVGLATGRGSNGDNFINTVFDDEATTSIADGDAPFTGSFRPETPLSVLNNGLLAGIWTLSVFDEAGGEAGTIDNWSLNIQPYLAGYTCVPYEVNAAKIEVTSPNDLRAQVATVFTSPLQVRVLDGANKPLAGVVVTFTAPTASDTPSVVFANNSQTFLATTNSNGVATSGTFTANTVANSSGGRYTVEAKVGNLVQPAIFYLTNVPDVPHHLTAPPHLTSRVITVGTNLVPPLQITVTDQYNNPVWNPMGSQVAVSFTVNNGTNVATGSFPGNATIYNTSTNSDGKATAATLTANTLVGQYSVTARATGIVQGFDFTLTNQPGPPHSLEIVGDFNSRTTVAGTAFAIPIQVKIKDSYNNPLGGKQINFAATPGSEGAGIRFSNGSSSSLTVNSGANGVASAGQIMANNFAGGSTVTVSFGNLTPIIFYMINTPDIATVLALIAGSPQGTDAGTAFPARLKVKLEDQYSNGISGTTVVFSAPSTGASGVFSGSTSVTTDARGYAEAPPFIANAITGTYTVTATASNFSASFKLTNWQACGSINPFIVTVASDDGAGLTCGTLGRALFQAENGTAISFNLGAGNSTLVVTGALPPVKPGVKIGGSSCDSQGLVILDGNAAPSGTSGLVLQGQVLLQNLKVTRFKAAQIVAHKGANNLKCVKVVD